METPLLISILIPTFGRPDQLAQALASLVEQDQTLIGEVVIGDDSDVKLREANLAVIAASPLAPRIRYFCNEPPLGNYPNQWFLAEQARNDHVLLLHDDDWLCPGGLSVLAQACEQESDQRVKLWFGRNLVMDEQGQVDMERTRDFDRIYGKLGGAESRALWQWCLTESVPPNSFLISRETYTRYMRGPRDGNAGDWGLQVRLANSGAWASFVPRYVSAYRVQAQSVTSAGRGMDAHIHYELTQQLVVPPSAEQRKRERFSHRAKVATVRYLREGERVKAWKCFVSSNWRWNDRFSVRGAATVAMMLTPRVFWMWGLRYR